MATQVRGTPRPVAIAPVLLERLLAAGAVIMLVTVIAAVVRGHGQWSAVPAVIWWHLSTILLALV